VRYKLKHIYKATPFPSWNILIFGGFSHPPNRSIKGGGIFETHGKGGVTTREENVVQG
jgi:hypothetical protein